MCLRIFTHVTTKEPLRNLLTAKTWIGVWSSTTVKILGSWGIRKQRKRRLWSVCAKAQTDLSLRCSHNWTLKSLLSLALFMFLWAALNLLKVTNLWRSKKAWLWMIDYNTNLSFKFFKRAILHIEKDYIKSCIANINN